MSGERAFLAAIRASFGDHTARLVYADWLEERGRRECTFLRLECELTDIAESAEHWVTVFERLRTAALGLDTVWVVAVSRVPIEQLRSLVPGSVLAVARQHIAGLPPVRGYVWQLSDGRRVPDGWYFDYSAKRVQSRFKSTASFGYAPGYLVSDNGTIRTVGWGQLQQVLGQQPLG